MPTKNLEHHVTACLLILLTIWQIKAQMMPEYDDYPQDPDREGGPPGGPDSDYPMPPPDFNRRGMGRRGGYPGEARKNEVIVGRKRFKLYEKKRLNFKRATEFCRKKDGKLAEANSLEEMRRLESLFMRARMIGMDVWVGADKKQWKKHSLKEVSHPGLNLNKSAMEGAGIKAMIAGAGQKEHCPAISLNTRSMSQVQCVMPLPFICEYHKDRPRTTRKPKGDSTTTKGNKKKGKGKGKDPFKKMSQKQRKDEMK